MDSLLYIALACLALGYRDLALVALVLYEEEEDEEWKSFMGDVPRFAFEKIGHMEAVLNFRFEKEHLPRLCRALRLPDVIECTNGLRVSALEALCILLRRFAYPGRYVDLIPLFGRSKTSLSHIVNKTIDLIYNGHKHLLSDLKQQWLQPHHLKTYADAVAARGAPLTTCWGFIASTARPICRPKRNQRVCFSGHDKLHCLKFQAIMVPNGLFANVHGPFEGSRHESAMLRESNIISEVQAGMNDQNGSPFVLYGNNSYPLRSHLIIPFQFPSLARDQEMFNTKMSAVRQCVEWGFGKVIHLWGFLDDKKNQKLLLQPVGIYYLVGVILTNCHTTLYGSETTSFFGVAPPSLEEYLSGATNAH